jgi:mono/diheme cytochrome c family protein
MAPSAGGGGRAAPPPGEAVFWTQGCTACHRLNGSGGYVGPELSHIGASRGKAWIEAQLRDPRSHDPSSIMPSVSRLPAKELDDLADYLESLE